jgi:hypothetical protein
MMQIQIYQWLVPLIAILFYLRVIRQYHRGHRSLRSLLIWGGVTLFVIGVSVIPDQISFPLADFLGFKSNINAVIFVSLGILFGINYSLSVRLARTERKLADLVRSLAKDAPHSPPES